MNSIFNNIKNFYGIDVLATPFTLKVGKKTQTSTHFSIILTKLLFLSIAVFFALQINSLFSLQDLQVSISAKDLMTRKEINLNSENFIFAFRLEDYNGDPLLNDDDLFRYFTFEVMYLNFSKKIDDLNEKRKINFSRCNRQDFNGVDEYFIKNKLDTAFCLSNFSFDLTGYWDEDHVGYFYFNLNFCENSTDNQNCETSDKIKEIMAEPYISLYIENYEYDFQNMTSPIKRSIKNRYNYIESSMAHVRTEFYKKVEFYTDSNFMFTDPEKQEFFKYHEADKDFMVSNTTLFQYFLYTSDTMDIVRKTPKKISDVLALIGGFSQFLYIIFSFTSAGLNRRQQNLDLLNEVYNFDLKDDTKINASAFSKKKKVSISFSENQSKKKEKNNIISKVSLTNDPIYKKENYSEDFKFWQINERAEKEQKNISNLSANLDNRKSESQRRLENNDSHDDLNLNLSKLRSKYYSPLSFSLCETLILSFFPCLKSQRLIKKEELYQKGLLDSHNYIDILGIITSMMDLQKIKFLFMTKDQISIFNFLSKPLMALSYRRNSLHKSGYKLKKMFSLLQKDDETIKKISKYYESVMRSGTTSEIDCKLFEWLDDDMKFSVKE